MVWGLGHKLTSLRRVERGNLTLTARPSTAKTTRLHCLAVWPNSDANALRQHYAAAHHPCTAPDCAGALVAFASEEELRQHCLERHSSVMPRWDRSRARPLALDAGGGAAAGAELPRGPGGRGGGRGEGRGGRGGRGRQRGAAGDDLAAAAAAAAAPPPVGLMVDEEEFPELGGGNFRMIDDDDHSAVLAREAAAARAAAAAAAARPAFPTLAAAYGRAPAAQQQHEEFPSLQAAAAAAAAAAPAGGGARRSAPAGAGGPPQMTKAVARCPCGRRAMHLVVRAGAAPPPPLACDAGCEAAGRRARIADAFGVADPDAHAPYFERHRAVAYSPDLIRLAKEDVSTPPPALGGGPGVGGMGETACLHCIHRRMPSNA